MIRIAILEVHEGDNSQLCQKNNETYFLHDACNSKNAIHNLNRFCC